MATTFPPSREADIVAWALNFSTYTLADPVAYGLDATQATDFRALYIAYNTLYTECNDPGTRTPSKVTDKKAAKKALLADARRLIAIVQAFPGTTDGMRSDLNIRIRDYEPTPIPVPDEMPVLRVKSVQGFLFELSLRNQEDKKTKPEGARAAWLYTWVGDTPSPDLTQWQFKGETTRSDPQITLDQSVGAGTTVWFTALWVNPTGKPGPACAPVKAHINYDGLNQAA
ncbi:hypothetical protein OT109_18555 [Phycisphaeraceae bacterium D3-23]